MDSLTTRFNKDVFGPYLDLLRAEYRFHSRFGHAKTAWEEKLTAAELINGPFLEKSLTYREGESLQALSMHPKAVATIQRRLDGRGLWKHQTDALRLLLSGKNAVIATGTSSGKTLCYQIPILNDLLQNPVTGLRAIIIYPLNALVNDQLSEWENILAEHPAVTFGRFTGQTPDNQQQYETTLRETFRVELVDQQLNQQELQRAVEEKVAHRLKADPPNRLNHREAIRARPPNILITNFSMLEYLLERPIDASIFERSRLKYLVLDEAHAYRGIQATEIAFLVRRLKDRLGIDHLQAIATSATLGRPGDGASEERVREFASKLFGEPFPPPNPIYGTPAETPDADNMLQLRPEQYVLAAEQLRKTPDVDLRALWKVDSPDSSMGRLLEKDGNLVKLRRDILRKPIKLKDAAQSLWPGDAKSEEGLQALLEVVAAAKRNNTNDDLLPTRLHYFIRAQDGLHVCLHLRCPGRRPEGPSFHVSRRSKADLPEGDCPDCYSIGQKSKLVEVVSCRKCGYLYGALQDLGPRRAQSSDAADREPRPHFDSFSTELGWASDSYWSYLAVDNDLPYPEHRVPDEDDDEHADLLDAPAELEWCVVCGKKKDKGEGDNCQCATPHLRHIKIFHRQCPKGNKAKDRENLHSHEKTLLGSCPNCGARNVSGIEPVQRFQESDDEMGLAMAVPLAHFQITPPPADTRAPRKLLCFTDHRQRAAAFPSLLEEETFARDMGRKIVETMRRSGPPMRIMALGESLADAADSSAPTFDPDFFLPVSRFPDQDLDAKAKRDLWIAETFAYFGIPDAARESAEDFGLVAVEYALSDRERSDLAALLRPMGLSADEARTVLQVLLGYVRKRKAFTLPKGRVTPDAPAFGRIQADISFVRERQKIRNTNGWLPHGGKDNVVSDYLRRALRKPREETLAVSASIWDFLTGSALLIRDREDRWKLGHEKILVRSALSRHACNRCGEITAYSFRSICPRKGCEGQLLAKPFDPQSEGIVGRWVAGEGTHRFSTLKSEEHTAQINRELAKRIEDRFRGGEDDFRVEGVNVLSSTTTFEMGINIGDLQKVLLRNAPPASANYIQRVGRAGRGKEKNSIAVTLCRRTKYDADSWGDPLRLMSGEVRAPTVYLANKVIAQRHFNALVFATFLRQRLRDEQLLGPLRQRVRLEAFLPREARANIPQAWFQMKPRELYLDFPTWLKEQSREILVRSDSGAEVVNSVAGLPGGKESAVRDYQKIFENIADELVALMREREQLHVAGGRVADVEQAVKNLLASDVISVLAKRGFLPRYAFPLDVVPLETGRTRWSGDTDVELNRDRGIAIAEFAPGAQVIAHKKVFTSAGLYIVSEKDRPELHYYSRCSGCDQIRVGRTRDAMLGACSVCGRTISANDVNAYVSPAAFSVRIDEKHAQTRFRRSTLIRQKQTLTHFIDQVDPGSLHDRGRFRIACTESGSLFRYNLGPANGGFMLCSVCGCSEPLHGHKAGRGHKRLRSFAGSMDCRNDQVWARRIAYGHEFRSFCLIARPTGSISSVESVAYALQRGVCMALDLEPSDIGVSWRAVGDRNAPAGMEIVLYDQAPGGAGFVKEAFDNWQSVTESALKLCEQCNCEKACYDCLKSYGNQAHHDSLDRKAVLEALRVQP